MDKKCKNMLFFARFLDNSLQLRLIDLKVVSSCSSHFSRSGKYPLDILCSKKVFSVHPSFWRSLYNFAKYFAH